MTPSSLPTRSALARRSVAGALASLVLLGASACSSDDATDAAEPAGSTGTSAVPAPDAPDTTEVPDAAETPESPATQEAAAGETVDRDEFIDLFKASISKETTARISLETSSAAGDLRGAGDIDFATTPPSISLKLNMPQLGGDSELRLIDGVAFVKLPQLGGKYVSFDLSDPTNPLGSAFADQLDIESQFDAFGDAIQEVTYVGTEDIDGEQLERYTLTVDGKAVAEQAGAAGGAGLGAGADLLPDVITYDVWFDAEGLFRQLTFDLDEQGVSSTISYSDWGKDVSITAPKPSQVTSLPGSPGSS